MHPTIILFSVFAVFIPALILPGPDFRLGPSRVFMRVPEAIETGDITNDGRTAVQLPAGKRQPEAITIVTDWTSLLRRR